MPCRATASAGEFPALSDRQIAGWRSVKLRPNGAIERVAVDFLGEKKDDRAALTLY
jgi:hypothetical protein